MTPPLLLLALALSSARASDYPLPAPPAVSTATEVLDYTADHLDYASTSTVLHLKGHVVLHESTWTIKSDELWLDTKDRTARSQGYILVESSRAAASGASGSFDFAEHTGVLNETRAGFDQWRVKARRANLSESKKLDYESANFTSCDYIPPHYHFHATKMWVVPKKYMFARNVVFYIGPVPLFYTPFFYKSLEPSGLIRMKLQPGYDRRNGAFVKGTVLLSPWRHTYGKLYLDEYSSQGLGHGAELEHRNGASRAGIWVYHIKETSTRKDRWAAIGDGYQVLASSLAAQFRAEDQSDAAFNNDYSRASLFPLTPQLINNGAITYRMRRSSLRLSYSRLDNSTSDSKWQKVAESAPRLDFQTQAIKVGKLPWLNTFTGFIDNTYAAGQPFIQRSANGAWEATRTVPLVKGRLSFTPRTLYSETAYNRFDEPADNMSTSTVQDVFVGRLTGEGTLRWRSPVGDWDLDHLYTMRQKADAMARDAGGIDHGVEANITTLTDAIRPNRQVLFRIVSGYDYRIFRDHGIGFRDRVQPITSDVSYAPNSRLNFSLRDAYSLSQGNESLVANAQKGDERGSYASVGFGANKQYNTRYFVNNEFGYAPSSGTWRAAAALRSEVFSNGGPGRVSHLHVFEKEISLTKNWHDFYGRAQIRFRPGGVREFQIRAELKFGKERPDQPPRRDWESEWFPERAGPFVDRP